MSGFSKTNEIYLYGDNDWSTTIKFHQVEEGEEGKYHGLPKGTNIMVFGNDEWEGGEECDMIKVTDEELKELEGGMKPKHLDNFDQRIEQYKETHKDEVECVSCGVLFKETECTGTCATNEFGPFDKYLCEKCHINGEVCFNCNLYFEAGDVIFCDTLEEGHCEKCWKNCGDKNCEGCLLHEE